MPTFTGKTFSSYYKRILQFNQSTNDGVGVASAKIQDGDGGDTAIRLSDDQLVVLPNSDNTTSTFSVANVDGNNILAVDTTNSKVLLGESQVPPTNYAHFATDYNSTSSFAADTHYAIPFNFGASASTLAAIGSSTSSSFNDTNPASSLTLTTASLLYVNTYWYVMDDITIDAVKWLHTADTATGDSTAAHLMAYTVDIDNGSTSGDLSSGVVVADGATITNAGDEQIYYQSMTVQSADVDAGKVILFTFASDTISSDYSLNCTVKYHIR